MIPINVILDVLSSDWLIDTNYLIKQFPLLMAIYNGQKFDASALVDPSKNVNKPFVIAGNSNINTCDRYDLAYDEMPGNSVALIPVQGPLMGSDILNLMRYLQLAEDNDKVIAAILLANTPGGQVFQLDNLCGNISGMEIPVFTYVIGMCCSAGAWITSASDRIFCSSKMDILGSVGAMTSVPDMTRLMRDKLGIDIYDFYARLSTEKNQPLRGFLDPNATPEEKAKREIEIYDKLDFVNSMFHDSMVTNLGIKKDSPVFTGKTFYAEEAINEGLAHEIQTLDYVIDFAHKQGLIKAMKNQL